jgi:hypothetical protein
MLTVALTVTGFSLAADAIRPVSVATNVVRRAWFLADLARFDAVLTRATVRASRHHGTGWKAGPGFASLELEDGKPDNELRVLWTESGARVFVDGEEHRLERLRIGSIEHTINPDPFILVEIFDPHRGDGERWYLAAPLGHGRAP